MDRSAVEPLGLGMQAFLDGDSNADLVLRREDGLAIRLPVAHFFRDGPALTPIELAALGWQCDVVLQTDSGEYLARLSRA